MREDKDQRKTVMQWTLTTQLHNLNNADDIRLFSQKLQYVKAKTNNLHGTDGKEYRPQNKHNETNVIRTSNKQKDEMN